MACCRALVAEYGTLEVSYGVCQNDDLFLGTLNISGHAISRAQREHNFDILPCALDC